MTAWVVLSVFVNWLAAPEWVEGYQRWRDR